MSRLLLLLFLTVALTACQQPGAESERGPLEGAWEMVSGTYTTPDTVMTLDIPQVKILTAGHFAFGRSSDVGAFAGGGQYTYEDGTYREIVRYHSDPDADDTTLVFEARFEGDSLWYHSGNIGPNFHLEEVWRRLE